MEHKQAETSSYNGAAVLRHKNQQGEKSPIHSLSIMAPAQLCFVHNAMSIQALSGGHADNETCRSMSQSFTGVCLHVVVAGKKKKKQM